MSIDPAIYEMHIVTAGSDQSGIWLQLFLTWFPVMKDFIPSSDAEINAGKTKHINKASRRTRVPLLLGQ